MIKKINLSKLPVRFTEPNPYKGSPIKLVSYLIWFPLSALFVWTCLLHLIFGLSSLLSVILPIDIALSRSVFWEVLLWPAPLICILTVLIGLWPNRIRISPSSIEIRGLPLLGKYEAPTASIGCTICLPVRLELGPLRRISRLYEVVILQLRDGAQIMLGYGELPGDSCAYAREVARLLGVPCVPGLPDETYENPIYISQNPRFVPSSTRSTSDSENVPKGLQYESSAGQHSFRSLRGKKPAAQALIIASLPLGLLLLSLYVGGAWWLSVSLGICAALILAWHYWSTPTFPVDTISVGSYSISLSRKHSDTIEIPISKIEELFLASPGYHFPVSLVFSTGEKNYYFSGGLAATELDWLGRHVSALLTSNENNSSQQGVDAHTRPRFRPSRHEWARKIGYEKVYRKRPRK